MRVPACPRALLSCYKNDMFEQNLHKLSLSCSRNHCYASIIGVRLFFQDQRVGHIKSASILGGGVGFHGRSNILSPFCSKQQQSHDSAFAHLCNGVCVPSLWA